MAKQLSPVPVQETGLAWAHVAVAEQVQTGQYRVPVSVPQQEPRSLGQLASVAVHDDPVQVTVLPSWQSAMQVDWAPGPPMSSPPLFEPRAAW
ncbi:MAG: hypothetical protein PVG07_08045 [Acidobacteriota bacterium]|jgi:hypothetical protein